MDLSDLRRRLLDARDSRASLIASLTNRSGRISVSATSVVFLSLNVPGPDKNTPWLDRVFARGRAALLRERPRCTLLAEGRDALGPYAAASVPASPRDVKMACVGLEESLSFGRLLDLDVLGPDGGPVGRASLGLPPRACLVCDRAAVDCIRAGRHSPADLWSAVRQLERAPLTALAHALVDGARAELALTPKPGLVDRLDNGSHPDLSYELMSRSVDALPRYYDDLIELVEPQTPDLAACVAAGVRVEDRMRDAAGGNTHRGYVFLSGLLLLAAASDDSCSMAGWRQQVAGLARQLKALGSGPTTSHGGEARRRYRVSGVIGEALAGLPSVFDYGLPALERGLAALPSPEDARHYALAVLMTTVEDTTALHRCGREGLDRLKRDGAALAALIENGGDHLARLRALNDEYRAMRLTMGGVADCLALTLAVHQAAPSP